MAEKFQTRMYALHLTLTAGGYKWFTGFDEEGRPQWFVSKGCDGFMKAKHYMDTKAGWAEADKIKATFKEPWLLKMLSMPCEVEVEIAKMIGA